MQEGAGEHTHRRPPRRKGASCSVPSCLSVGSYERPVLLSQRSESKSCWQGANTQEQGVKDLEFEKPSCLVEALNCTPLKGARTTNQCEEPQAEMRRPALGQRRAPKHSRAHLRVWSSRHGGLSSPCSSKFSLRISKDARRLQSNQVSCLKPL